MNVIVSWVIYHYVHNKTSHTLYFDVIDLEGSVLLSYADIHALGLELAGNKMDKNIPSGAKLVISQADRSDVFTTNKRSRATVLTN